MTKNQRDSIIAAVMVAAFAAAMLRNVLLTKKQTGATEAPQAVSTVETQLLEDARFIGSVRATQTASEEQGGRWDQEWERDPFRAEETVSGSSFENLALNGIFWDEESARAIVNGKTLRLGDSIDGYKLVEIRRNSVVLWTGEKNLQLSVFKSPFYNDAEETAPAEAAAAESEPLAPPAEQADQAVPAKTPLPDIGLFKGLNKNLQTVESFVSDTQGAERMAEMMGAKPAAGSAAAESRQTQDRPETG